MALALKLPAASVFTVVSSVPSKEILAGVVELKPVPEIAIGLLTFPDTGLTLMPLWTVKAILAEKEPSLPVMVWAPPVETGTVRPMLKLPLASLRAWII